MAEPGGICVALIVNESVGDRIDISFEDAGEAPGQEYRPADPRVEMASRKSKRRGEQRRAKADQRSIAGFPLPTFLVTRSRNISLTG